MQITYRQHEEIDRERWDKTILASANGNLYGLSWYLDAVAPGWDALTAGDYEYIMPLTANKKFGIYYLFRPILSQQLGVFSTGKTGSGIIDAFLDALPAKYKLIQYSLNSGNVPSESHNSIRRSNFLLNLNKEYSRLSDQYSDNHRRNLRKIDSSGLKISEIITKTDFFNLLREDPSPGSRILSTKKNLPKLSRLIGIMHDHNATKIIGMLNPEGWTEAAVLFGISHKKWFYLVPVSSPESREKRAHFAIIDHLVKSRSGNNEMLDFEGSDIPGLAQFYKGFGAEIENYYEILINRLPWPIKYMK